VSARHAWLLPAALLLLALIPSPRAGADRAEGAHDFYFFFSHACSRCDEARPFVRELELRHPEIRFHYLEIVKSRRNQELFMQLNDRLHISTPGVPVFVMGDEYLVGYRDRPSHRAMIAAMIKRQLSLSALPSDTAPGGPDARARREGAALPAAGGPAGAVTLPLLGELRPFSLGLPLFTALVGLADGFNPCSLWVLMFLLSLLASTGRGRLLAVGSCFVLVSAAVYFMFLVTWLELFWMLGSRRTVTLVLGGLAVLLGAVNMKELFFFGTGVSLVIPARVKPMLYARMRGITGSPSLLIAVAGAAVLAFLVSFVELGCTAGLPAVYTRVLSAAVQPPAHLLYLGLYVVLYAVPLGVVLAGYAVTLGRFRLQERHGRILKPAGGALLFLLGLVLLVRPELLSL